MQYDNTPTVVALLVSGGGRLLAIRRANEPGRGLIGLPGGYHMRGESWQQAGAREVYEETGYALLSSDLLSQTKLISMVTDEYGNNLVIAHFSGRIIKDQLWVKDPAETQEVCYLRSAGDAADWAFPRHYAAAVEFFK